MRSPNILPIPGTASLAHLRENLAAAALNLPSSEIELLNESSQGVATSSGIDLGLAVTIQGS
jgi:pyridoxine 4-dehydrogenase